MNKLRLVGWLLIGSAILLAAISLWLSLETSEYTVLVDGDVHTINGSYETVDEVLSSVGVELRSTDKVSPSISTSIDSGVVIEVERARSIAVQTDSGSEDYWTHQTQLLPFLFQHKQNTFVHHL